MQQQDFPRFQTVMATLAVTYGKDISGPLTDVYWEALKPLYIEQLERTAKTCIRHHKHFPRPADLFGLAKEEIAVAPKPHIENLPETAKWLGLVNGLFLRYLLRRRVDEKFEGDANLEERRAECLMLACFFEELERDQDPEATPAELKVRFDRAMARVKDVSEDRSWLDAQLEFQKRKTA